jgi:hypothetical protein
MEQWLRDPQAFAAPGGLPAVALKDPAFKADSFWRGPVWHRCVWMADLAFAEAGQRSACAFIAREYFRAQLAHDVDARESIHPLDGTHLHTRHFTEGLGQFVDLFIKRFAGLQPAAEGLRVDPVALTAETPRFRIGPFLIRGQSLVAAWDGRRLRVELGDEQSVELAPGERAQLPWLSAVAVA